MFIWWRRLLRLWHTHPVQVKDRGVEIPGIFAAPPPSQKIGDRGHNGGIGVLQLPQLVQLVSNRGAFRFTVGLDLQGNTGCHLLNLTFRHRHRDPVSLPVLKMTLPLRKMGWEDLTIKLIRLPAPKTSLNARSFPYKVPAAVPVLLADPPFLTPLFVHSANPQGEKGEPKSGPFGALKRKSPPPFFPLALGHGNDGKPFRFFSTFPHPAAHPHNPLRLSPCPRENILLFFPWPKGHRGAYIINIFYSLFYDTLTSCYPLYPHRGHILSICSLLLYSLSAACQAP